MRIHPFTAALAVAVAALMAASLALVTRSHDNTAPHRDGMPGMPGMSQADMQRPVSHIGSVALVAPGATAGSRFTARVKLANFVIDPGAVGTAPVPGRGHLHFQLDGGKFDYPRYSGPNGRIAAKAAVDGQYSPSFAPEITYSHIPKGRHVLKVFLAQNNHVRTGAQDELSFSVR